MPERDQIDENGLNAEDSAKERRQGKRKDRSRGGDSWMITRRPPSKVLLSPALQGPLDTVEAFEPPQKGKLVRWQNFCFMF